MLTAYADIAAAARDTETFASGGGVTIPRIQPPAPLIPFEVDAPRHGELRALLAPYFTTRALTDSSALAERVCDELAEPLAAQTRVDLMGAYALPMACLLFAEHVGVPVDEQRQTIDWLRAWVTPPYDAARLGQGLIAYDELLTDIATSGRGRPGSFLAEVERAPLGAEERHGLRFTLLLAGVETTLFALGNALVLLADSPAVRDALLADTALVSPFVEEALRLVGPAEGHARTVARDVELHGQRLRHGDRVLLVWPSGSRDPAKFPAGDGIDLAAATASHLAFGYGPHKCLGAPLARIELAAAVAALLRHLPKFRIDPDADIEWYPHARGPMQLPVLTGN